jgi:hypothetical protein
VQRQRYELYTPEYQLHRLKLRFKVSPAFKKAVSENITPIIINFIESRVITYLQNVIISIFGETGLGKSYVAISLCELICKLRESHGFKTGTEWSDDHIHFDISELLDRLKYAKPGESFILDEQTTFFGTGSQYVIEQLGNIEMTCRKRQVNFFFCSPVVRTHYHNYVFEPYLTRWPKQRCTVLDKEYIPYGKTICFVYSNTSKKYLDPIGHVVVNHPKNLKVLRKYEKRKDKYIKEVLKGESINIERMIQDITEKFLNSEYKNIVRYKKEVKRILRKHFVPGGMPNTMIDEIATEIMMRLREDDE